MSATIKVSFINLIITVRVTYRLLVIIFFLYRCGLIEVECREGKVALAGVFIPLRNRVIANIVSNLIKFKISLLFGLYRDPYY
jgi:hypothetical protein